MAIPLIDVVLSQQQEKAYADLARTLDWKDVLFLSTKAKPKPAPPSAGLQGMLTKAQDVKKRKTEGLFVAVKADPADFRSALEQGPDLVFGMESMVPRDPLHARASGLNHVLCAIAKRKGTLVGLDVGMLLNATQVHRAQLLGRAVQNIALCKKYRVPVVIASFARQPWQMRSPHDLLALAELLGLTREQALAGQAALRHRLHELSDEK